MAEGIKGLGCRVGAEKEREKARKIERKTELISFTRAALTKATIQHNSDDCEPGPIWASNETVRPFIALIRIAR